MLNWRIHKVFFKILCINQGKLSKTFIKVKTSPKGTFFSDKVFAKPKKFKESENTLRFKGYKRYAVEGLRNATKICYEYRSNIQIIIFFAENID